MNCPQCQTEVLDIDVKCGHCGAALGSTGAHRMIGQVVRVDDTEVTLEISPKVEVKVVRSMIADVRTRGAPVAANDGKPPSSGPKAGKA